MIPTIIAEMLERNTYAMIRLSDISKRTNESSHD